MRMIQEKPKYIVKNENVLGYKITDDFMGILRDFSYSSLGNPANTIAIMNGDIRRATKNDFENFRVMVPPDFS